MGISIARSCFTNSNVTDVPNPDPSQWIEVSRYVGTGGFVVQVKYHDCTNYEGNKVLVFKGEYRPLNSLNNGLLDPHFSQDPWSPIARFQPTDEGWDLACDLANRL